MTLATPHTATPMSQLDEAVRRLKEGSRVFAKLSVAERISLLETMMDGFHSIAEASVKDACEAKGIDFHSPLAGEEWLGGPMVTMRNMRLLKDSLRDIQQFGHPRIEDSWLSTLPDGRLSIRVFPNNTLDALLLARHRVDVHMQKGVTKESLREHQAHFYQQPHEGKVCVVLGAGNQNSIPPMDCMYKLFVEGTVCVLKMNPVNDYVGPHLEKAFEVLVKRGFLAVVYGGADEGSFLVNHDLVDEIHITGSEKTHDALVWGPPGPEREVRKARNEPVLKKEITSELGNISPVLVVPGPYSPKELEVLGRNVAGMVAHNASFNCNSAKLMVVSKEWKLRKAWNEAVLRGLAKAPLRKAYYPGAEERWQAFVQNRKNVQRVGEPRPGVLPYALLSDVPANQTEDRVFHQEPWCSLVSEVGLPSTDAVTFLRQAVEFVNEKVWGTLAAMVVVHPSTLRDPVAGREVEKALRHLRYGSVCVNTWAGAVYGLASPPWGGHPSSTLSDIQSGRGFVHNTYMLENIEKAVMRAPLTPRPISPWFPGHRTAHDLGRRLVDFEHRPSWGKLPALALAAYRG